ncbi:PPP2R1A-PPP2R2A-interacting phosphatase regulator 1-like [Eriocheir sinensis]|uniref:PPP2R1A-PPP2R2A-interacting phosphatase regulator 1-like n=1 Tax=Eriocheir sinensis TaxID=95602 RepID=UPI0021C650E4|nr:PPP2R1A-PPP2R2A-interacting phosphatase regulator 1-like [Eriocheir sinensis]
MDVDVSGTSVSDSEGCGNGPSSGHMSGQGGVGGGSKLKRSSSAPMINQLVPQGPASTPPISISSREVLSEVPGSQPRVRRFSASFGPISPLSPGSSRGSGPLRVCQLRVEEGMDVVNREAAHERTVQSTLQITDSLSQSWEDITLTEDASRPKSHSMSTSVNLQPSASSAPINVASTVSSIVTSTMTGGTAPVRRDYTDPLHLTIVPSMTTPGCGASPTRGVGRQCFSPALQQHVRNTSFCPSPSPTKRTITRRSLSPIALRPSPLGAGLKRKWDMDDRCEPFLTPSKRASTCTPDRCMGGLLMTQAHSVGSLESTPSPAGPGSLGSVGTPDSVCSSGSPGLSAPPYSPASIAETAGPTPDPPPHLFKPVSPALNTDQTASFRNQEHGGRYGGQDPGDCFGSHDHSDHFRGRESRDHFVGQEHNDHYRQQEHGGSIVGQDHRDQFGAGQHRPAYEGHGKGGDTSDGSSNDAMITEDVPANDLKSYQDMDLSESITQSPLNI